MGENDLARLQIKGAMGQAPQLEGNPVGIAARHDFVMQEDAPGIQKHRVNAFLSSILQHNTQILMELGRADIDNLACQYLVPAHPREIARSEYLLGDLAATRQGCVDGFGRRIKNARNRAETGDKQACRRQ